MPRSRRPATYHHGDLRRALIDSALPLLRDGGAEALTLHAVARAAGVSQTAPYRHFADRAALVAAVAEDGFRRLRERLIAAARAPARTTGRATQTARGGLQAIALAYVRFALEHPQEYRVMFGAEVAGVAPAEGSERQQVYALLRDGIAGLQQAGLVRPGDPGTMALSAWSLVHGLAMLALDGAIGAPPSTSPTSARAQSRDPHLAVVQIPRLAALARDDRPSARAQSRNLNQVLQSADELTLAATDLMMFGMAER